MEEPRENEGTPVQHVPLVMPLPIFAREELTPELVGEVTPLLMAHWREVANFKAFPLDPDWNRYFTIQQDGGLRVYTAREHGRLLGYNAFFVGPHIHYKTMITAQNDVVYVDPCIRGLGKYLRAFAEGQLKNEGIHLETYHVKTFHAQWEPGLERDGFVRAEAVWCKLLNSREA